MINRIPDYLKLFIDEEPESVEEKFSIPQVARFCNVFDEVTGLKLDVVETRADDQLSFPWSAPHRSSYKISLEPTSRNKIGSPEDAREFEDAFASLLNLLVETRGQLRQREAELAAAVPVVSVEEDGQHLAERLHHVLRGAAELLHCSAAGLYMLDEATTSLKLRSSFGLSDQALLQPPRPLEDAVADIEALAGHAVVIEDVKNRTHWRVPYPCRAAMCVPISSSTTILGTLWLYRDVAKDFTPNEQNLAEITSGRIAADLERAVLTQEVRSLRKKIGTAPSNESSPSNLNSSEADWVAGRIARLAPAVDGWDVSSDVTNPKQCLDFCHWHEATQDRLHMAVGTVHGTTNKQLSSVACQSAHAAHTLHDPKLRELFDRTNQTLWTSSIEGEEASLFHAILDPSCGRIEYAILGDVNAYILRPHAWEPLLASRGRLGVDFDCSVQVHRQMLMPGDVLLAVSAARRDGLANAVAEQLLRNTHLPADQLTNLAIDQLRTLSEDQSLAVLVAKRDEQ